MIFIEKDTFLTYNLNRGEFMSIIWFVAFLILLIIEIITINNHILDRLICSSRILFAMIGVLILSAILFHNKMLLE